MGYPHLTMACTYIIHGLSTLDNGMHIYNTWLSTLDNGMHIYNTWLSTLDNGMHIYNTWVIHT